MSVKVNPPPALRIPVQFFSDPDTRAFFEQQREILFQLWNRTGGPRDAVAGKQVVVATSSDVTLDNSDYGSLIVVDASDAAVSVTLPPVSEGNIGETIDVAIVDATFDTTVIPQDATIFGDNSAIMTQQFMSIQYTAISTGAWIGT